jgi:hypothetical protein
MRGPHDDAGRLVAFEPCDWPGPGLHAPVVGFDPIVEYGVVALSASGRSSVIARANAGDRSVGAPRR